MPSKRRKRAPNLKVHEEQERKTPPQDADRVEFYRLLAKAMDNCTTIVTRYWQHDAIREIAKAVIDVIT